MKHTFIKVMVIAHLGAAGFLFFPAALFALEHTYTYENNSETQYVTVDTLVSGEKIFTRRILTNTHTRKERFVLDQAYETKSFSLKAKDEDTDYTGTKTGNTLVITGTLKGKKINTKIVVAGHPFYFTPKFNLTGFVLSDAKEMRFWTLRKDTLSKVLMQAVKAGSETISVTHQDIRVIVIDYSPAGFARKFYERRYFYRADDGVFIKKKALGKPALGISLTGEESK